MTQQPLDPRKSPWKRGDVCTLGFEKVGFVLSYTSEYLEIRWNGRDGIERVPAPEVDDILRVAHADSVAPGDPPKTNLELLRTIEALERVRNAAANRTFKNDREKSEADNLVRRSFATDGCDWDKKNSNQLFTLAIQPETVGVIFKLRERLHRLFCRSKTDHQVNYQRLSVGRAKRRMRQMYQKKTTLEFYTAFLQRYRRELEQCEIQIKKALLNESVDGTLVNYHDPELRAAEKTIAGLIAGFDLEMKTRVDPRDTYQAIGAENFPCQ